MGRPVVAALVVLITASCAAAYNPAVPPPGLRFAHHAPRPGEYYGGGVYWLWSPGIGLAVADCGAPWVAIAGGGYSSTATDIGTGFPGSGGTTWEVYSKTATGKTPATVWAYALCAPSRALSNYFYRVFAVPTGKHKTTAIARCNSGDLLLMGWGYNETSEQPFLSSGKPTGWIAGGASGTSFEAAAECATAQEVADTGITALKKSGGSSLYVACDGDNDDVIGGAFGAGSTGSGGSEVPQRQYPGVSAANTLTNAPTGMWFFAKSGVSAWVLCQDDA